VIAGKKFIGQWENRNARGYANSSAPTRLLVGYIHGRGGGTHYTRCWGSSQAGGNGSDGGAILNPDHAGRTTTTTGITG